jgi:hypothetical protein
MNYIILLTAVLSDFWRITSEWNKGVCGTTVTSAGTG